MIFMINGKHRMFFIYLFIINPLTVEYFLSLMAFHASLSNVTLQHAFLQLYVANSSVLLAAKMYTVKTSRI